MNLPYFLINMQTSPVSFNVGPIILKFHVKNKFQIWKHLDKKHKLHKNLNTAIISRKFIISGKKTLKWSSYEL